MLLADGVELSGGHLVMSTSPPFTIVVGDVTNKFTTSPRTISPQRLPVPKHSRIADNFSNSDPDDAVERHQGPTTNFEIGKLGLQMLPIEPINFRI